MFEKDTMSKKAEVAVKVPAQQSQLYVTVNTYGTDGKQVGTRVVDMYHYGTRNWLQNHMWWAMHHAHSVETLIANEAEVADYIKNQEVALAEKFNSDQKAGKVAA